MFPALHYANARVGLMAAATLALALAASGACAQDSTKLGEDPFSVIMKWRPTTDAPDMPGFIKKSRPPEDQLNYTPLTGEEPTRPKRLTPAELSAQIKQLDAAGAGARARAAAAFPAKKARRPARTD